jgi:hypothetical protein
LLIQPRANGRRLRARRRVQAAGQLRHQPHGAPREPRRVVVERLTGGEHQACDALGPLTGQDLREPHVALHERHVAQVEPLEELRDQAGVTAQGQVRIGMHGVAMRAQGQGRDHAAVVVAQLADDVAPERSVHGQAVEQDQHGPVAAGVLVVDGSRRQLDLWHHVASSQL